MKTCQQCVTHAVMVVVFIAIIIAALFGTSLADTKSVSALSEEISKEKRRADSLTKENVQVLTEIETGVLESLEDRRRRLQDEVDNWREERQLEDLGVSSDVWVDVAEIRRAIVEAEDVARAYGLDVEQMHDLYEKTKKVIRQADFAIPGQPDYDKDEQLSTRIMLLFAFAHDYEEAIADARRRHQKYKVGLYKNAAFTYIDALLAGKNAPGECDLFTRQPVETHQVDGIEVPSYGCPDPVVRDLRKFLNALLKIQSADAETLTAEAEMVVAQQQLASDLISSVPLVGDALDFYVVYSGEDLAGSKFPPLIRKVMALMVLLPAVNSRTAQSMVDQVTKRSKSAAVAIESLNEYFRAVQYTASDEWYKFKWGGKNAASAVYAGAAKQFYISVDEFKELIATLRRSLDNRPPLDYGDAAFQMQAWRKIREGIQGRVDIDDFRRLIPGEIQERVLRRAERNVREGIMDMQGTMAHAVQRSGIHKDHVDAFRVVAMEQGEIIIVRPVNPMSAKLMDEVVAATKHMGIKSKSASEGPITALIPVNQALNKKGSELQELLSRRNLGGTADEIAELEARISGLKRELREGAEQVNKCLSKPNECAQAVVYKVKNPAGEGIVDLLVVKDKTTGRQVYGVQGPGGKLLDPDTGKALDIVQVGKPQKVEVLATPDGVPITADYDILSFASHNADYERLGTSPTKGGITESQVRSVDRINELIDYPGGNVVHHGAEDNFFGSKAADFPVTIFEPDGSVIHIPACDAACMVNWCKRNPNRCTDGRAALDPDRLLKDYFYLKKLQDFNLDPNPNWKWGPFNVFAGFAARIHHAVF